MCSAQKLIECKKLLDAGWLQWKIDHRRYGYPCQPPLAEWFFITDVMFIAHALSVRLMTSGFNGSEYLPARCLSYHIFFQLSVCSRYIYWDGVRCESESACPLQCSSPIQFSLNLVFVFMFFREICYSACNFGFNSSFIIYPVLFFAACVFFREPIAISANLRCIFDYLLKCIPEQFKNQIFKNCHKPYNAIHMLCRIDRIWPPLFPENHHRATNSKLSISFMTNS